jgi:hypothetical protein
MRRKQDSEKTGLKSSVNLYIVVAIAGFGGSGASGVAPADLQENARVQLHPPPPRRKQEIGTWKTSRHKIFRTRF